MLKEVPSLLLISRFLIAIPVIAVVAVAATHIEKDTRRLEATIIKKNIGLVTIGANEYPGQILTLSTRPETERIVFQTGDQIIVEYNADLIIQSIARLV